MADEKDAHEEEACADGMVRLQGKEREILFSILGHRDWVCLYFALSVRLYAKIHA